MKNLARLGTPATGASLNFGARVIARFGTAQLLRQPGGRHELVGGSPADCTEAREWCSLFAPEVVFRTVRPRGGAESGCVGGRGGKLCR